LALKDGETSDWVYSETFGYFRIHCNATSAEDLEKIYREKNEIAEETEIKLAEMYTNLLQDYDSSLVGKAIWEKGQELGVTFADRDIENKIRSYLGIEKLEEEPSEETTDETVETTEATVAPEGEVEGTEETTVDETSAETEEGSNTITEEKTEEKSDEE
jgi:foldase protein PrsA